VASNSLDEKKMANMELYEGAKFDSYGVGEKLITSATDPVFGGVYKLVAVKNEDGSYSPKMKCSDSASKAIIPGKLMAWRVFDEEGKGQCDIISMDDEVVEAGKPIEVYSLNPDDYRPFRTIVPTSVEQLLVPHIIGGELVIDLPDIKTKKAYIKDQLEHRVWESELRPEMPHVHYVDLTLKVKKCRDDMYESLHGGKI
jgi:nicotinate phosphoribosyltransferase